MKTLRFLLCVAIATIGFVTPRAEAHDQFEMLGELQWLLKYSMLQAAIAKELCSCHFVSALPLDQCESHAGLASQALMFVDVTENGDQIAVHAAQTPFAPDFSPTSVATFNRQHPRLGCGLTYGMMDALAAQPAHSSTTR